MGLLDILSNPQMIGMAMAGLSRDREAPQNAMRSMAMVDEMNRRGIDQERMIQEDARKEKERADNLRLLQAITQGQAANSGSLSEAIMAMQGIRGLPQTGQQFIPDQQAGTAVDYETGQAFTPQETRPRSDALNNFYTKYAQSKQAPQIDLSQFPNASPQTALAALTHQQANDPRLKILEMIEKQQEKGDTRDWEERKIGIQHQGAVELENIKQKSKKQDLPNTETELRYAFEHETDPAKKAILRKVIQSIEQSQERKASLGRPPKDNTFEMEEQRAWAALRRVGIDNPTEVEIADQRRKMFRSENPVEKKLDALKDLLTPGGAKNKPTNASPGTNKTLNYDPKTGTFK